MSTHYLPGQPQQLPGHNHALHNYQAQHFKFSVQDQVATIGLNRPERKTRCLLSPMPNCATCSAHWSMHRTCMPWC